MKKRPGPRRLRDREGRSIDPRCTKKLRRRKTELRLQQALLEGYYLLADQSEEPPAY